SDRTLVETSSGNGLVDNVKGNIVGHDPDLQPLANNGGPTRTISLNPGSPAIDAGFNVDFLPFDQRGVGFPRTLGARTDIGAFETAGTTSFIVTGADAGFSPHVKVFDAATGNVLASFFAFDSRFHEIGRAHV